MDDTSDTGDNFPIKGPEAPGESGRVPEQKSSKSSSIDNGNNLPHDEPGTPGESGNVPEQNSSLSKESPQNAERPHLVPRLTALRGQQFLPRPVPKTTIRRNTMQDLKQPDPKIPYVKTERAIRDLVCSLLERQDRMNEVILCRLIDLEYRIDDLETDCLRAKEDTLFTKRGDRR
jgi:hypothetical protein